MKTVRRLLYRQIASAVAFATLAFLALFFFFDMVEELQHTGRDGYTLADALWSGVLAVPGHLYDVFPITLLIGTIVALSRLAQTSEFTILRTGGLGPGRALGLLALLGALGMGLMVVAGEWLVPTAQTLATQHRSQFNQGQTIKLGQGGAWLRERPGDSATGGQTTIHVGSALGERHFQMVRIFQFNAQGEMVRRVVAQEALIDPPASGQLSTQWQLRQVVDTRWYMAAQGQGPNPAAPDAGQPQTGQVLVNERQLPQLLWSSQMSPQVVAAAVLPIDTMSTGALWRYTRHLSANAQAAQKYELQFWKKAFAPLACLVMVALALPFAYLQARSGGISVKVFGGIMLGISFVLVNHITSHLGLLHQWQPWLAAITPSVVYTLLSLSAFLWLVRNR
jgi:lipopolysaccharide export system permease protein